MYMTVEYDKSKEELSEELPTEYKDFLTSCDVIDLLSLLDEAKQLKDNASLKAIHEELKKRSYPNKR